MSKPFSKKAPPFPIQQRGITVRGSGTGPAIFGPTTRCIVCDAPIPPACYHPFCGYAYGDCNTCGATVLEQLEALIGT